MHRGWSQTPEPSPQAPLAPPESCPGRHNRAYLPSCPVPVGLLPEDEDHWLDPDLTEPEEIVSLLRPYPAALLAA